MNLGEHEHSEFITKFKKKFKIKENKKHRNSEQIKDTQWANAMGFCKVLAPGSKATFNQLIHLLSSLLHH